MQKTINNMNKLELWVKAPNDTPHPALQIISLELVRQGLSKEAVPYKNYGQR